MMETSAVIFEIVTGRDVLSYLLCGGIYAGLVVLFPNFFSLKE